jgi:hypothetical protein
MSAPTDEAIEKVIAALLLFGWLLVAAVVLPDALKEMEHLMKARTP